MAASSARPQQLVRPKSVEELQNILRQRDRFPSPVRAMGSYHSLTPCVSSPGTIVDMKALNKVVKIDAQKMTFTAQAGLEMIEAADALRKQKLQFILNIEIGNMTLGLGRMLPHEGRPRRRRVRAGQFVCDRRQVGEPGRHARGSVRGEEPRAAAADPRQLRAGRHRLRGDLQDQAARDRPIRLRGARRRRGHPGAQVSEVIASNECMVCWTVGHKLVIQTRNRATELRHDLLAEARRFGWSFLGAFAGARHPATLDVDGPDQCRRRSRGWTSSSASIELLSATGGFTLYDPDKMINYSKTPKSARYAFTFWAFPRKDWVKNLNDYVDVRRQVLRAARIPLQHAARLLFHPAGHQLAAVVHATTATSSRSTRSTRPATATRRRGTTFLREFNEWAHPRGGIPLLNQSPFITKQHVVDAYGDRWKKLSDWVRTVDPDGRMVSPFFAALLA